MAENGRQEHQEFEERPVPTTRRSVLGAVVTMPMLAVPALAQPASAEWAFTERASTKLAPPSDEKERPFTFATLAASAPPPFAQERARKAFERELLRPVALRHFRSGPRLIDAIASGGVDGAVHTSLTFAASSALCECSVPILRPVAKDGTAGLRALLLVRDEGPRSLDDLASRLVLGTKAGTVAGEVARTALVRRFGVGRAPFHDDDGDAAERFEKGEGAALFATERIDANGDSLETGRRWRTLWRSFPLWHGPIAVSREVNDGALRQRLLGALLVMRPGDPPLQGLGLGRISSLVGARPEDYAPLVTLLRS